MEKKITLKLPKSDVKFIKEAKKGDKEIEKGKFKPLGQLREA